MVEFEAYPRARVMAEPRGRAQRQPAPSFERLFSREYARVVAIAQRVLGDRGEAEDVAQEVFLAFHRRHAPDAAYASAWLHSAAVHRALNVVRGKRRRLRREATQVAVAATPVADPQEVVAVAETRREVRAALARLPARNSAVLALRYSGLSYGEVAAALGVGVGQVGTMLRRAEAQFRKEVTRGTSS